MEFEAFTKKGFRSFFALFILVVLIEVNGFSYVHRLKDNDPIRLDDGGDDKNTILDAISRAVVNEKVRADWKKFKKDGIFTETTGIDPKKVKFSSTSDFTLKEVFHYLQYFPLLESRTVEYTIPVDGREIKLLLTHDATGTFRKVKAKYLYPDPADPTKQKSTDLSNPKDFTQELIAHSNAYPDLQSGLESAMPKILDQKLGKKNTYETEIKTKTIPKDILDKAFRNAVEAMASTSMLRKKPETWIGDVHNKIKQQTPKIAIENEVKEQWEQWKESGSFTESGTNPKLIKFKKSGGGMITPSEIFHNLQYFTHLENGPVQYTIPIDGRSINLELAPDDSGGFTAKSRYPDPANSQNMLETDLSHLPAIIYALDRDVVAHPSLKNPSVLAFLDIFKNGLSSKDKFKKSLAEEAAKSKTTVPKDVEKRAFRQTAEFIASTTILGKNVPQTITPSWLKHLDTRLQVLREESNRNLLEDSAKEKWEEMKEKQMFTETTTKPKTVTFADNADLTVNEIFDKLKYFPVLESEPVIYKIPVDGRDQEIKLKLTPDSKGKFTAKYLYLDSTNTEQETDLSRNKEIIHELIGNTQVNTELSSALESSLPKIFNQKLDIKDTFKTKLDTKIANAKRKTGKSRKISPDTIDKAFRQALEVMASTSILGNDPVTWLDGVDKEMETKRNKLEKNLNAEIKKQKTAKLKYELAESMVGKAEEAQAKWKELVAKGNIIETMDTKKGGVARSITITDNADLTLKETFKLLQHFNQLYPEQGLNRAELNIPIGGEQRTFLISEAYRGDKHIMIEAKDKHWPGTTKSKPRPPKQGKPPKPITDNTIIQYSYQEVIERGLKDFPNPRKLAEVMLESINRKLNDQPNFDEKLEVSDSQNQRKVTETLDTIRSTVEFLLISMVGEAAHLPSNVESAFNKKLALVIKDRKQFPAQQNMPSLQDLDHLAGRSPTADEIVIKLLREMIQNGRSFDNQFKSTSDSFPFMLPDGGTKAGREYMFNNGDEKVPSTLIGKRAASDHDGETIAKRARMSCTGKRSDICSLEEINDDMIVDDKTIVVEDTKVKLDVVDRRDATKRKHLEIQITPDELATPKLVKEKIEESKRPEVSQKYAKVNKGLAVHGLIFSALGAIDYFQRGEDVRGGIAVSQSLHTLGGMTGFNEIASKAAKQVLRHSAFKIAKGLGMEKGLEQFSAKVEKYMEKGVGKLMGDLPGVGLAFDIYFIEQDIEALAHLDLNNPEDVKMLPLRVVDLVLDVDTTVLNLIGTFCPAAEVITEPLIIVLSIVRMAIDDFYLDIMEEMDKVNWHSPWAGFEFIGALFKGIIEGAADFLSGGLRRQMKNYSKQEKADNKLISSLKDATSYYKIKGNKGGKTIDFTQGKLSSFGGFINFRMLEGGWVHVEIGDVTGKHGTVKETFKIDEDVTDIVLGIGESREFLYEKKTAKLWLFIPVKHYKLIKTAYLKQSSLHGIYYGNSKDNKFYAVQKQKKKSPKDQPLNDYGKININFVTGHYHYNLYGRGGNDLFYLGPQMSHVTGGQGSDVYIVQSYGGNTIIDNFAEDNKRDMVIINVPYKDITCSKNKIDLDILYQNTHHIRITNWFVPGSPNYYRHISFKSIDGIIFVAKDFGSEVKCTAIAIAKGLQKSGENIFIDRRDNPKFSEVKQVVGTDYADAIHGNDLNNILDGGKGDDYLMGGRNEDTYIIRANEGRDSINNNADDYKKTTDVVIFEVPYEQIALEKMESDLLVYDNTNEATKQSSSFKIKNWFDGESYRHMILTSSDHVVFKIKTENGQQKKFPMVLDYSSSTKGVKVDLSANPIRNYIHYNGFDQVATVSDSKHSDSIKGNKQSNFLSCTGGSDSLYGGGGSDNYVVKKSCKLATIINLDPKEKVDLLLLDYNFLELSVSKEGTNLIIKYDVVHPKVVLWHWYGGSRFQHLWIRTKDGVTLKINGDQKKLEPVEISKDPVECQCKKRTDCERTVIKYDLNKDPWKKVTRFQLNSSYCSYHIKGNHLNNYIDPGSGNGYNFQHLKGRNGADTYVLKHGYGEFNIINNFANDKKNDTLKLGLEINDIQVSFYGTYDVILASKSRPSSLTVRVQDYFRGDKYQHLRVITSDKAIFEIQNAYPFMKVISLDLSLFESPQTLPSEEMLLASEAQTVQGSQNHKNVILGTSSSKEIDGGSKGDIISGGPGDNIIDGKQGNDELFGKGGNDIIFGGDGDDFIKGGNGNDYIYGGEGKDSIDGGSGGDTMAFKGDGFNKKGVHVDLLGGLGKGADAEGDTYKSIEHVYGTIHSDIIIGSDSDNNLYGRSGDDVIIAKGGNDRLVGGNGTDRYILDNANGVKIIDNYAQDKQKDTISLANTNSKDVCIFLVDQDLYLQVEESSLTALLYQNSKLTVIVPSWNHGHQHRHLNILFKDTFWSSHILAEVRYQFKKLGSIVQHVAKRSSFKFTSQQPNGAVGLKWTPIAPLNLDEKTQLSLFRVDMENPQNIKMTEIAGDTGKLLMPSLKKDKHYIFALFLKYCSAIISTSYSLSYFGEEKACQAISVTNSQITYKPAGSFTHGTEASLMCSQGYKFNISQSPYKEQCLDGKWKPKLPTCLRVATCPRSNTLIDGVVTYQRTKDGVVANCFCDKGFKLVGSQKRHCIENGKWGGVEPKCERVSCVNLPKLKHGKFSECPGKAEKYGTMEQPKQNFCVKMTCDANFVEEFKVSAQAEKFKSYRKLGKQFKNRWFCREGKWKGFGEPECLYATRLFHKTTTWHEDQGVLQEWDDPSSQWKNSVNPDVAKHRQACSNALAIDNYNHNPRILKKDPQNLQIACPKIRFVNKVTQYEGKLEILIENEWQPVCLLGNIGNKEEMKQLQKVYQHMCQDLGLQAVRPGIAQINNGPTTHVIGCSRGSDDINDCKIERFPMTDCNNMLQCRRRCNNAYPVPNAKTRCTGKFEGNLCKVYCKLGFKLVGSGTVYCKSGVWSDQNGNTATSRCDQDPSQWLAVLIKRVVEVTGMVLKAVEKSKKPK